MPRGTATKPGDVVTAMNGKTIHVVLRTSICIVFVPFEEDGVLWNHYISWGLNFRGFRGYHQPRIYIPNE